ncbi:MAG TPA: hypothetical protein VHM01_01720 [Alphaproteobacteria bacterium]|nr:hypothetical protein [Alphaproteobacteria bacterium]
MLRAASVLAFIVCGAGPALADHQGAIGAPFVAAVAGHPAFAAFDLPEALALMAGAFVVLSSGSRRSQAV